MASGDDNVVVKKIKKKGAHEAHGGAWKVAYADFVTAMMALFMVLWILSQGPEVKKEIAYYFTRSFGMPDSLTASGNLISGTGTGLLDSVQFHPVGPQTEASGQAEKIAPVVSFKNKAAQAVASHIENQLKKTLESAKTFAGGNLKVADAVEIHPAVEGGISIELIEKSDGTFFETGSSNPTKNAREAIASVIQAAGDSFDNVIVEGHTDARPYVGGEKGYSNFELSCDRANSIRRLMLQDGVEPNKITEVRGFADRKLLDNENPLDPRNRRVSILLLGNYGLDENQPVKPETVNGPSGQKK